MVPPKLIVDESSSAVTVKSNPEAVTLGLPLLNDNVNVPVLNVAPVTYESETDAALTVRSNVPEPLSAITTELSDELYVIVPPKSTEPVPVVPTVLIDELTKDAVTDAPLVTVKSIPAAPVESTKLPATNTSAKTSVLKSET